MTTVPHSAGTARAALAMPRLACDAHIHVYDRRFASIGDPARALASATAADYRGLQRRLGSERVVVVTPTVYGTDNAVTLDAIARLDPERARGIAVLHPDVTDATLAALDRGGIRGIRFTLYDPATAVTTFAMVEPLAARIAPLGWHVQLHWRADQIEAHRSLIERLPCPIVFDHYARLPACGATSHPAFEIVTALLEADRAWVKLSAPYLDPAQPGEPDAHARLVGTWLARAPDQLVWGSDWPHPTEKPGKPDDAVLLDRFGAWVADAEALQRVLVDNPARLYGFSPAEGR